MRLSLSMAAKEAVDFIGLPEGNLALAEAVVYMCLAPKSNALYTAYGAVRDDVEHTAADPVPLHLRNAPTKLMKDVGYGKGYEYAHDCRRESNIDGMPTRKSARTAVLPSNRSRSGKADSGADGADQENQKQVVGS